MRRGTLIVDLLIRVMSLEAYNPDFVIPEASVREFLDVYDVTTVGVDVEKRREREKYLIVR